MTENLVAPVSPGWLEQVVIRRLHHEDLPALEWEGEYRRFRRNYAEAYQRMKRGISSLWVADMPSFGIIGQIFLQFTSDRQDLADGQNRAYFYSFRVRPQFRSAGVGGRLLQTVEQETWLRGIPFLCLNVARDNLRAQEFYLRHGYEIIEADPGIWYYYDDEGGVQKVEEPAWRMQKQLRTN